MGLFDKWSLVHIAVAAALTVWLGPLLAFVLMVIWEVFEWYGQEKGWEGYIPNFWKESTRNRIGDIISGLIGIGIAIFFFT